MLRNFRTSESGNVAIMFAFALLPLLGGIGLAVDYARMSTYQAQMQSAVDAAALSLAYSGKDLNEEQLKAAAEKRVGENFENSDAVIDTSVTVERGNDFVSVSGNAHIRTTLMNLLGHSSTNVNAFGKSVWGSTKLEVVLVLDNSTSMKGTRLAELKKAAKELITILEEASFEAGSVKIGLVPFASAVRVNRTTYQNAEWISFDGVKVCNADLDKKKKLVCPQQPAVNKATWGGCILDRDQNHDVADDGYTKGVNATLYPAIQNCPSVSGYSEANLGYVAPLSENFSAMRTSIDAMRDGGVTNLTIGMAFGMALLSSKAPFTEGVDPALEDESKNKKTEKIIIALSDGDNTKNRFTEFRSKHTNVDARNELACNNAKAMARVYTILLVSGNETLLRNCASSPEMYKKVNDATSLIETFRAIGKEITKLRLAV